MPLHWEKTYGVGIQEIDHQHQQFLGIMNSLYQALETVKPRKELGEIMAELITYAKLHFQTEERYFDLFHYAESDEHKKIHREMLEKLLNIQSDYQEGKGGITIELVDFIEYWLIDHLATQDQKYVQCFKDHGIT